ncbi:hypothetical protein [Candidatus Regiella endosymbiont of Tuberolachnus salignus]|uniref:hypothetical protein n=1 Tax=Candidatus Regiella endosymbiont of Tuberolachnus salignus TaxID=3077956 RepID=UPI0030CF7512
MKRFFILKKIILLLVLIHYGTNGAYAIRTQPTSIIQGHAPKLNKIDFLFSGSGTKFTIGEKIQLEYSYQDEDGDADDSANHIEWYAITSTGEKQLPATDITNTSAPDNSATGKSTLTIPTSALGATGFKVKIIPTSLTGIPHIGEIITIDDITANPHGTPISVTGPVGFGDKLPSHIVPGIYASTDTGFTTNLIGNSASLQVNNKYIFKLFDNGQDITDRVNYTWYLEGKSATDGKSGAFNTGVKNTDYTVPANITATLITGSIDGAQGFSLAVDYE